MPADPHENLLDRPLLRQLAGEKAFARGEQSFRDGRVRQLQAGPERASARVEGSRTYRVRLWQARRELQWTCTCPLGQETIFCHHAVAVGLAWLGSADAAGGEPGRATPGHGDEGRRERLAEYLQGIPRERLIALLLEATDYDDILRRRLLLESIGVARIDPGENGPRGERTAQPPDFDTYRQTLREAIETHDYVDHDAMPDYAQGVEEAVQPLGDLLHRGYAAFVVELTEFTLVELERAGEMLDGGDGSLNRVYDHLQYFHLEACRLANLDRAALAARLLAYELEGGLGIFNNAANAYAEVLGAAGLAAWRRLLGAEWEQVTRAAPAAAPGGARPIDHRRFRLQSLMENLAEAEGGVDALIAIRQRELASPHDFLALAELCRAAGRTGEALAWAERGWRAFPADADASGLRDFLVEALHGAGRNREAFELVWADFARAGDAEGFRRLAQQARQVPDAWPDYRERALKLLREHADTVRQAARKRGGSPLPDHSGLVEILLDEGAVDEAWDEARRGGCRPELSLRLAALREESHPADALEIYRARVEPTLARGGPTAYQEAVGLLGKVRGLLARLGRAEEFDSCRAEVRAAHARKRAFLKLLDAL